MKSVYQDFLDDLEKQLEEKKAQHVSHITENVVEYENYVEHVGYIRALNEVYYIVKKVVDAYFPNT